MSPKIVLGFLFAVCCMQMAKGQSSNCMAAAADVIVQLNVLLGVAPKAGFDAPKFLGELAFCDAAFGSNPTILPFCVTNVLAQAGFGINAENVNVLTAATLLAAGLPGLSNCQTQ